MDEKINPYLGDFVSKKLYEELEERTKKLVAYLETWLARKSLSKDPVTKQQIKDALQEWGENEVF